MRSGVDIDSSKEGLVDCYWGWVFACVTLSANRVASTPLRVYASLTDIDNSQKLFETRKVPKIKAHQLRNRIRNTKALQHVAGAEEFEELIGHPLIDLLFNVNENTNQFELLESTSMMLDLTGDAYWLIERAGLGIPEQLYPLKSQFVTVETTNGAISQYIYSVEGKEAKYSPEDILHFRYPNPRSDIYGLSPTESILRTLSLAGSRENFAASTFTNMGRPDLLIKYQDGEIAEEDKIRLESEWNSLFKGSENAGRVKVTDHRYDVEKIGWSPSELAFDQGEDWIMKKICAAFSVPVGLIDTTQISKAPRSGMEGSDIFMAQFNTLPRLLRIEQKLNEQLCPMYDNRLFVAFDDPVPKNTEAQTQDDVKKLEAGLITINEIRERDGLAPVTWGDEPFRKQYTSVTGVKQDEAKS